MVSFPELVIAITFAFILSHISMLLLLGRQEELSRGLNRLTAMLAGDDDMEWHSQASLIRPQPIPAGNEMFGAPINHQSCYL